MTKGVLALVKSFLEDRGHDVRHERENDHRTPQGGILSPLLANVALSVLDGHFMQEWTTAMSSDV